MGGGDTAKTHAVGLGTKEILSGEICGAPKGKEDPGVQEGALLDAIPCSHGYLWALFVIPKEDLLLLGDGGGPVEVHQLIEGVELLLPEEIFAIALTEHLEVLDVLPVAADRAWMDVTDGSQILSSTACEARILL